MFKNLIKIFIKLNYLIKMFDFITDIFSQKLYHGSAYELNILKTHEPRGDNDFQRQKAVFLTSNFIEAALYSIARDKERKNKGWGIKNGILYLRNDLFEPLNKSLQNSNELIFKYKLNEYGYVYIITNTKDAIKNPSLENEYVILHDVIPKYKVKINPQDYEKYIVYLNRNKYNKIFN